MLIDQLVAYKQRLHRLPLNVRVRIRERSVGHAQSRPGRERHGDLVGREMMASDPSANHALDRQSVRATQDW